MVVSPQTLATAEVCPALLMLPSADLHATLPQQREHQEGTVVTIRHGDVPFLKK